MCIGSIVGRNSDDTYEVQGWKKGAEMAGCEDTNLEEKDIQRGDKTCSTICYSPACY